MQQPLSEKDRVTSGSLVLFIPLVASQAWRNSGIDGGQWEWRESVLAFWSVAAQKFLIHSISLSLVHLPKKQG